jgi:hypothetical protein
MNERGHYGTSRIGKTADDVRQITRAIEPRAVFFDPEAYKLNTDPDVTRAVEKGWWSGSAPILIGALAAIIGIGVIGAKRGVKLM